MRICNTYASKSIYCIKEVITKNKDTRLFTKGDHAKELTSDCSKNATRNRINCELFKSYT